MEEKILFNETLECNYIIPSFGKVCIQFIDDDFDEKLINQTFLDKITLFLNDVNLWHPILMMKYQNYFNKQYGNHDESIENVYICSYPDDSKLYIGFSIETNLDIEHAFGVKFDTTDSSVVSYGEMMVALAPIN